MENKVIGLVTFANPNKWSMVDERTGEVREGNTIEYIPVDSLKPLLNEDGTLGTKVVKESLPTEKIGSVTVVPAFYTMTFAFKNVKGKLQVKLDSLELLSEV
ncbi:hypothetical protein [Pseudobacteroides cellulosolvens]|uniref:Uncharacterized protein n=1 Tax=Pseudobacteroides cellulosolvens ATCC 35603 = DSM 2933 TaxID=398512 RepID=A0A0L6JIP4_9FIRM|nr:hypothetical protein [Pseudobacteroides cellulosolvens]KNY25691.1 hypothetical protein Bccel_0951 [Pseudobacteroides cellulosolvens ATCC 35603 = DSM 2933]KNY25706.1 hypothetical protein Bccel_0966 [Pseudobacteroides cellulosolvens ATCC 35603 = DSM 2933]